MQALSAIDFVRNASKLLDQVWVLTLIFGDKAAAIVIFLTAASKFMDEPDEQEKIASFLRMTPAFSGTDVLGGNDVTFCDCKIKDECDAIKGFLDFN